MRYTSPQITGSFPAVSAIQSMKGTIHTELNPVFLTNSAAYQADE